ncbi:hypothetical protein N9052_02710 [bacterium]|nr:hypothetical protein [bacterium]
MSWLAGDDRQSIIGQLPALAAPLGNLYQALWSQSHVPPAVLELCRLRLAQLHGSEVEWRRREVTLAFGEAQALDQWESSELFGGNLRACLAFTEVYAMDAQALTDAHADLVKSYYGEAGLVLLVEALGILDGMTRLSLLWQLPVQEKGS